MDPKLEVILKQVGKFGFIFYGYDESGRPLVTGPNGQVIDLNLAITFVNNQIKSQKETSGSVETGTVETAPEQISSPEHKLDTKLEEGIEDSMEQEGGESAQQGQQPTQAPQKKSQDIKFVQPNYKPYDDGFDPKTFNVSDIQQTLKFIEDNSRKSNSSSNKWLAKQFKKFIEEVKAGKI